MKLLAGPSLAVLMVINWSKWGYQLVPGKFWPIFVVVSSDLCFAQLSFCVFGGPIVWQFSKNSLFKKKGARIGFFNFLCFKFKFWTFSFLGLLKHYINRVSANSYVFVVEGKENRQNMICGIPGLFFQKWPFSDGYLFLRKCLAETPILIVFWGARFFGQVVKKGKFWTPTKKEKVDW